MNKKGAALALVLIIGVVLASSGALMATMAKSSISTTDTGIKSREAEENAKSGYDFIRVLAMRDYQQAYDELQDEYLLKEGNPNYNPVRKEIIVNYLGYLDEDGEDIDYVINDQITQNTPEFKKAKNQVGYTFTKIIEFEETDNKTKEGTFHLYTTIDGWSRGRDNEALKFTDILDKGIVLDYSFEKYDYKRFIVEIDPWVIPGTGVDVEYYIGENFHYNSNAYKSAKWDTFYDPNTGKYYIDDRTRWDPLFNSTLKVSSVNDLSEIKILPPEYQIWDLTGWKAPILLKINSMNDYLRDPVRNPGFTPPNNRTLKKFEVVRYGNGFFIYLDPLTLSGAPPGSSWIKL